MPIYEYACVSCENKFEKQRPFRDATASISCPKCNGEGKKLLSVPAPAMVPGGTNAGKKSAHFQRIGDWNDNNEWVDG